ncbi:DUF6194 family protein [Nocardia rhizosphaerae]|uniref:DUF6194 family protein n=1 Tax=Nocardia rhizosphaerae TaxID=1691571 RepID=A0ABV8L1M6_9NOCA
MTIDDITEYLLSLGGVLPVFPEPGGAWPEISWGDSYFYYAPDGVVPTTSQPFATIVTKRYPDEPANDLDRPGAFRVNVAAGRDAFIAWTGHTPGRAPATPAPDDTIHAHPVYGSAAWLAVTNPADRTAAALRELLRTAHTRAAARFERRPG